MRNTAEEIVRGLVSRKQSVGVAESCTGGLVSSVLVDVPGASACFCEGYVTYSNEAKEKNLGVSHGTLERFGAVSEETAAEMAEGVRKRADADYGVATTGIAGPDGGSAEKPVGLVYIGCASAAGTRVERHIFSGDRREVRTQAAARALELLYACMTETPEI